MNNKKLEIFTVYLLISIYLHKPNNSPRKNKMGQGEKINELWVWCNWGWNILAKISIFFSKKEIEYTTVLQIFEITWSMSESPYFFNSFALYDLIFSFCDFVFIYYKKQLICIEHLWYGRCFENTSFNIVLLSHIFWWRHLSY